MNAQRGVVQKKAEKESSIKLGLKEEPRVKREESDYDAGSLEG